VQSGPQRSRILSVELDSGWLSGLRVSLEEEQPVTVAVVAPRPIPPEVRDRLVTGVAGFRSQQGDG